MYRYRCMSENTVKVNFNAEIAHSMERIADSLEIIILNQKPITKTVKLLQKDLFMSKYATVDGVGEEKK